MLKRIDCVFGANYGDEGKGWAVYNIVENCIINKEEYKGKNKVIINILHNGGPQRGHTVIVPEDAFPGDEDRPFQHVFHCFGSATMSQIMRYNFVDEDDGYNEQVEFISYYDREFLFNPVAIMNEYFILKQECENAGLKMPKIHLYVHPDCRVIFPQDILINRAIERKRAKNGNNHGSCGLGIWECIARNKNLACEVLVNDLFTDYAGFKKRFLSNNDLDYLDSDYWENLLYKYCLEPEDVYLDENGKHYPLWDDFTRAWEDLRYGDEIDFQITTLQNYLTNYRYTFLIYEAGQGLCLNGALYDEKNNPNTTPSNTGLKGILYGSHLFDGDDLNKNKPTNFYDFYIWYCTRPYLTRHGNGPLENESIGIPEEYIKEYTNPSNEFQGTIRYAPIDKVSFSSRISNDLADGVNAFKRLNTKPFIRILVNFVDTTQNNVIVYNANKVHFSYFKKYLNYTSFLDFADFYTRATRSDCIGIFSYS